MIGRDGDGDGLGRAEVLGFYVGFQVHCHIPAVNAINNNNNNNRRLVTLAEHTSAVNAIAVCVCLSCSFDSLCVYVA